MILLEYAQICVNGSDMGLRTAWLSHTREHHLIYFIVIGNQQIK